MLQALLTLSNPAPTLFGAVAIVCGTALLLWGTNEHATLEGAGLIALGAGLATARQNNKTSEDVGAAKKEG